MALTVTAPYEQHNYMGEYADDATATSAIVSEGYDSGGNPRKGQYYYNTTEDMFRMWNGSLWELAGAGAAAFIPGDVYFVDGTNGDDTNTGLSPDTAFATIGAATLAAVAGDVIVVREGNYAESVTLAVSDVTLQLRNGVRITPAAGAALTISANYCLVYTGYGASYLTPVAGGTGVVVSGNRNYVYDVRVPAGSSGNIGFDITGDGNVVKNCRCSSPLTAAFKIQGEMGMIDACCTGGEVGDSSIGFWVTNSCDKARIADCGSGGHETAGFQIDQGCTNTVIRDCDSGAGDGHFIDDGESSLMDLRDRDSIEEHCHTYPRPDGEGTAGSPITVRSQINDETGATAVVNYWGDVAQIIPPETITSDWFLKGVNLFAITANDEQRLSFYRVVYVTKTGRNGGNAWDEGATVLTVSSAADAAKFQVSDLVWIRSPNYKLNGEIVKVTDVTGAVITIARQTESSGRTGLHWDHSTNDGGNEEMYLCWRSSGSEYHTSDFDFEKANQGVFDAQNLVVPRRFHRNEALIVRMVNGTDSVNSQCGVTASWSD